MARITLAGRRLGILLSGRGSNFQAIAENIRGGRLRAEVALVISNRPEAPGLAAAEQFGYRTLSLPSRGIPREEYDGSLAKQLQAAGVDLVVLAGYMRILSADFIRAFPQRILNIHPSLLPAFPGLDAQHQAFAYGVAYSGCTVHFVDEHLDHGPIVQQAVVPVLADDTAATLSARILEQEHRIYSEAISKVLEGRVEIEGRRVRVHESASEE